MIDNRCTYLQINGKRCTMPSANGKDLCFHHESRLLRMRMKPTPPSTFNTVPLVGFVYPDDHDAILDNIHSIVRALDHSMIDDRRAAILDRLMNTALRTLRQAQKLEKTVTCDEMIRHFRIDTDGNPRAAETTSNPSTNSPTDPPTQSKLEPATELATSAIIPAISAEAEEPQPPESNPEPHPAQLHRVTSSQNLSLLLSQLSEGGKLTSLLSNTYIFRNGKLILAPNRVQRSNTAERRPTAYIFLTNMR